MDKSFLAEIDAEVKNDEMRALWDEWQNAIIFFLVSVVVLTFAFSSWKKHNIRKNLKASYTIEKILATSPNQETLLQELQTLNAKNNGTYNQMIALSLAEKTKNPDVLAKLTKKRGDRALKDLARYFSVLNVLDSESSESLNKRLTPLLKTKNPWYYHGVELSAFLSLKDGKKEEAIIGFEKIISAEDALGTLKNRVTKALSVLKQQK
ncbi:MAG: tetratricopeptide repeat protein [Alphaproteobacteria bacterium]